MNESNDHLDLNLLRVFFAIWDLRSLTAAGARLGLTQPAISHALRRLRERFNDPLFVRAANRMLPTDVAVRLHAPLDQAFTLINRTIREQVTFDPRTTGRTFRIAMYDVAEMYALPRLVARLRKIAPQVRLDVVPLVPDSVLGALRSGEVDMAIGHIKDPDKDCSSTHVFFDQFKCMVRADHPFRKTTLSRRDFVNLRFFYARTTAPIHDMIEQWLVDEEGRSLISVRGRTFMAADVVRNSELATILPEAVAASLFRAKDFRLLTLPFDLPRIEVRIHTHTRFVSDAGIRWISGLAAEAMAPPQTTNPIETLCEANSRPRHSKLA